MKYQRWRYSADIQFK